MPQRRAKRGEASIGSAKWYFPGLMTATTDTTDATCPRCGERATGQFCVGCGAALSAVPCLSCAKPLTAGARFCHHCGATIAPAGTTKGSGPPAWAIAATVLVVLVAFIAGQQFGVRSAQPVDATGSGLTADAPFAGGAVRAPDISNMTAEEAASRLFDRVMRYTSEGKADSARMFAPMAILAYERIGPLDAHARYDIGTISASIGDEQAAAAQADTVLRTQPNHLLALSLAARAADLRKDAGAAARFRARLVAAAPAERAKNLKEYGDHARDIDTALGKPAAARP